MAAAVALLWPVSEATHISVLQRLISTLTHQNMILDPHLLLAVDLRLTSSTTSVMRDNVANRLTIFFKRLIQWFCEVANHDAKKARDSGDRITEEGATSKGKHRGKERKRGQSGRHDTNGSEGGKGTGEVVPSGGKEGSDGISEADAI